MEQSSTSDGDSGNAGESEDGDSSISIRKATSNNNQEDESVYGSEEFDDSMTGTKEAISESEYDSIEDGYGNDNQSTTSPITEGGSASQTTGAADGSVTVEGTEGTVDRGGEEGSVSDYADDSTASGAAAAAAGVSGMPPTSAVSSPSSSEDPATGHTEKSSALGARAGDAGGGQERASGDGDSPVATALLSEDANGRDGGGVSVGDTHADNNPTPEQPSATVSPRQRGDDVTEARDNGPAQRVDAAATSSGSARGLEERPQGAEVESSRLRDTVEEDTGGSIDAVGGVNEELETLKSQVEAARAMIISSLDDGEDRPEISLLDLILLAESRGHKHAKEDGDNAGTPTNGTRRQKKSAAEPAAETATIAAANTESAACAELERRVESLEQDLARAGQESRAQSARAASLERQLDAGGGGGGGGGGSGRRRGSAGGGDDRCEATERVATADIMALKAKTTHLVERWRQEKSARLKAERETQKVAGKVQVLSDHIEKLMMFLKHEATQKAKAHEQQRRLQKELELVKARSTALLRSNQAKDRVTTELREGSKILEDQLRLMDEKYMELRTKLDWTRQKADKDVRRARAQASTLRTKWALLCRDGAGGDDSLLDSVKVDSAPHHDHSSSAPSIMGNGGRNNKQTRQHRVSRGGGSPRVVVEKSSGGGSGTRGSSSRAGLRSGGGLGNPQGGRGVTMSASQSEPSLQQQQQQQQLLRQTSSGGGTGIGGVVGRESAKNVGQRSWMGASPATPGSNNSSIAPGSNIIGGGRLAPSVQGGVSFDPGLSAGSDPGGGRMLMTDVGDYRGGSGGGEGRGHPRPPWSEQGGKTGGGRQAPQLLYA